MVINTTQYTLKYLLYDSLITTQELELLDSNLILIMISRLVIDYLLVNHLVINHLIRSGRTGRAGRSGTCVCLYNYKQEYSLKEVNINNSITILICNSL